MTTPEDPRNPQHGDDRQGSPPPEYGTGDPAQNPSGGDAGQGAQDSDGGSTKSGKRTGIFVGGGVAGAAVIVAVVFAVLYATGTAPFGSSNSDDIEAATRSYVNAFNSQKVDDLRGSICTDDAQQLQGLEDGQGSQNPISVDNVDGVEVDGSTATAQVTASAKTQTGEPDTQTLTPGYKKEGDAWKVCPSLAPQEQPSSGGQGTAPQQQQPQQQAPAPQEQAPAQPQPGQGGN